MTTRGSCYVLWLAVAMFGVAGSSVAAEEPYYRYYFKERKPLTLDPSRVAVFRADHAVAAGGGLDFTRLGVDGASVKPHTVPGVAWVATPPARAQRAGVTAFVADIKNDPQIDFVSPVFLDERGLPALITRDLIVGFRAHVSRDDALAAMDRLAPGGDVLNVDYGGMPNVYRVRTKMRDGFSVLNAANTLAVRPDVAFAEPDIIWTGVKNLIPNDPRFPSQWGLHNTGQAGGTPDMDMDGPEAWDRSLGSESIIVAVLDDGVDQAHPDINQIPGFDATNSGTNGGPLNVCDNHGTAVAGCVSAIINNATGGTGIAPGVKVLSTKFAISTVPCDGTGSVFTSWVVDSLTHAQSLGARVSNTSWSIGSSPSITNTFASTRDNGMIHFAAAGNSSSPNVGTPASLPTVNSISALNRFGSLASFSNFGPTIQFTAPGQSIWTTDRTGSDGYTGTNEVEIDGTSFASPYAAGVAAMVLSVDSSKTPDEVEQIMQATALDLGDPGWDDQFGFGLVKAAAAMDLAAPSNFTCQEAVAIQCNSSRTFLNASVDNVPTPAFSCGDGSGHDGALWFSFVATDTSAHLSLCNSDAPDSTLAVYEGSCGQLTEIACSETSDCSAPDHADVCVAGLTVGETYYVQVAARTSADRGLFALDIGCSCLGACCAPPPLAPCSEVRESECAALGGAYGGPDTTCIGDVDGDGFDDGCDVLKPEVFQLPTLDEELTASNVDVSDLAPAAVVVDDFEADGRSIKGVRWWGAVIDDTVTTDGWLISFHEPVSAGGPAGPALGVYYCDASVVEVSNTGVSSCVSATVLQYEASLRDCCLVNASADSRSLLTPAGALAFAAEACVDYSVGIQAITGTRYVDDGFGGCTATATAGTAAGDFWGWQTTANDTGAGGAINGTTSVPGGVWTFGSWTAVTASCGTPNMAFELLTSISPGPPEDVVWFNGVPDGNNALNSQYGGELTDFITVDDFALSSAATINRIQWITEEEPQFPWSGRIRIEIYPDNGAMAPDGSGGPLLTLWVPDDGGTVTRTAVGPGLFQDRYRYDVRGLSIVLGPGTWWLGLAPAGDPGSDGQTLWATSHTKPPENPFFFGGEAHLLAPSVGFSTFTPWDDLLLGADTYDVNFTLSFEEVADCNCNGVDDLEDIATATSNDCNDNDIPDECEFDCNGNGIPDDCDLNDATSNDCNANGNPDECDVILGGATDANGNFIPDLCECNASPVTAGAEPEDKNRFLSIIPGNAGELTAIRVRLTNLHGFEGLNGEVRWVGPPQTCTECSGGPFTVASLQCEPHFMDWGSIALLDIMGDAVVPSSTYDVQVLPQACAADLEDESGYSSAVTLTTAKWGDVVLPMGDPSQPNFADISAIVGCFQCTESAPRKARCLLQPELPNACGNVSFADLSAGVSAFQGAPYGFAAPTSCP